MFSLDGYGIAVLGYLGLLVGVGVMTSKLVQKSSHKYMVAG